MSGSVWSRNPSWPKCAQPSQERGSLLAPSPPLLSTQSPPCTPNLGLSEPNGTVGQAQPAWPAPHSCLFGNLGFREQSPLPPAHGSPRLRQRTHQKALILLQHREPKGRARAEVAGAVAGVEFA